MKTKLLSLAIVISMASSQHPVLAKEEPAMLNDEAVMALKRREWQASFEKFKAALKLDPKFKKAKTNLAIAHNNFAMHLAVNEHKPDAALREFHQALYLDPTNRTTEDNSYRVIQMLGKDPKKFEDRVKLANDAKEKNDLIGAIVEYKAALKLREHAEIQRELEALYKCIDKQPL